MQGQIRRRRWPIAAGAVAGLLVWLYDYDFFLNAGGPATPVSRTILRVTGLENAPAIVYIAWPLCVLVLLGTAAGYLGYLASRR
jgi:hypothetical protein